MEDYEKLLETAYKDIKPVKSKIDRFEVPKIEGHIEGIRTILTNLKQIADYIRRDQNHLVKYLTKALATKATTKGDRVILTRKIPSKQINEKIQDYVKDFVLCKECGKPDTELLKQDRINITHCLACGAKHSVH
jgi:translation initiation factor 2 subunit 2